MQRYSKHWWAALLLSSVGTGGSSFLLLTVFTDLPIEMVVKVCVAAILVGDIALALLMESMAPTRIDVGPGERRHRAEPPQEFGTVVGRFDGRMGKVMIRGESWQARQAAACSEPLDAGARVRVVERDGLTLVVAAATAAGNG